MLADNLANTERAHPASQAPRRHRRADRGSPEHWQHRHRHRV